MKIGIDIDNVISNFNEQLLEEYKKHDKELRNTGIINEKAEYIRKNMFDWTDDEEKEFYNNNIEKIVKNLKVIDGAKEYIEKLKNDGHKIYIITGRDNGEYTDRYNMTKEWLEKSGIYYDKLILTNAYKNQENGKRFPYIFYQNGKRFPQRINLSGADDMIKESMFISAKKAIYSDCTV